MSVRQLSGFRGTPPLRSVPPSGNNTGAGLSATTPGPTVLNPRAIQNSWLYPQLITAASISTANGGMANAIPTGNQTAAVGGNAPGAFFGPSGVAGAPVFLGLTMTELMVGAVVAAGLVYVLTR